VVCIQLLNYTCPYCKNKGHTTKHCHLLANKQATRPHIQQVTNLQQPSNSWAAKAAANISPDQKHKIDEDNLRLQKQAQLKLAEKLQKDRLAQEEAKAAAKAKWQRWYLATMPLQFGLKEPYGTYPVGSFWEFFIEGRQFQGKPADTDLAKELRENTENLSKFRQYLSIKYYSWLDDSENTDDDCLYLHRLREQQIIAEENAYYDNLDRERKEHQRLLDLYDGMDRKLAAGEITQDQYNQWHYDRDEELEDTFFSDRIQYDTHLFNQASRRRQWLQRKNHFEQF
jgi:hypothetical protein